MSLTCDLQGVEGLTARRLSLLWQIGTDASLPRKLPCSRHLTMLWGMSGLDIAGQQTVESFLIRESRSGNGRRACDGCPGSAGPNEPHGGCRGRILRTEFGLGQA